MKQRLARIAGGSGLTLTDLMLMVAAICAVAFFAIFTLTQGLTSDYSRAETQQAAGYSGLLQGDPPSPQGEAASAAPDSMASAIARLEAQSMPSYDNFNYRPTPAPGPERVPAS